MNPRENQSRPFDEQGTIQPFHQNIAGQSRQSHASSNNHSPSARSVNEDERSVLPHAVEQAQIRILLASYSDILFVIMPFLLVLTLKLFKTEPLIVLASPEWALASAVLAGLAVVKLMLGLVSHDKMNRYRERLVFMVAATTFLLLMPSLLVASIAYVSETPPDFLVYVHPVLLIIAIAVYSGTIQNVQNLLKSEG